MESSEAPELREPVERPESLLLRLEGAPFGPFTKISPVEWSHLKRPSCANLRSVQNQGTMHNNGGSPTEFACTNYCPAVVLLKGGLADLRYLGAILKCGDAIQH